MGEHRWPIEDVLARTDLANLLDDVTQPANHNTRGRRWHCPVPEHDDQHASVTIHTDHRGHERWRCWSGDNNHRGDAIDLAAITQHLPRPDAINWLATRAGMTPDQPLSAPPVKKPTAQRVDLPLDPAVLRYIHACEKILWTTIGKPVRDWLHNRGFNDQLLQANHIGADPGRQMLHRQRGLPYGATPGATFPAMNQAGEITYVQTRYLDPGTGPKYDNPAAHLASNPRLAWTQPTGPVKPGYLIICEGIPDALTAVAGGYLSVAALGSSASDRNLVSAISRRARIESLAIVAAIDNDPAGHEFGRSLRKLMASQALELQVVAAPHLDMDLNEWTRLTGSDALGRLVLAGEFVDL